MVPVIFWSLCSWSLTRLTISLLSSLPLRLAFLEKRADTFLSVGEGGVEGHDLFSVGVSLIRGHLQLSVEGSFADADDERARLRYLLGESAGLCFQLLRRDHLIDESFGEGFFGGDELSGKEHLHRFLLADGTAQGDHRRGAEETYFYAGGGEASLFGGDDQIAGGGELAAGGGRYAVDLGYDGLGYGLDGLHELAADVEEVAVETGFAPDHLGEVVAGAEGGAAAAQDDDRCLAGLTYTFYAAYELSHVVQGEGVALFRTVHGDEVDGFVALVQDVLVGSFFGFDHWGPPLLMLAYLDELGVTTDLDDPVGAWLGEDQGTFALAYRDLAPQPGGQPDGVGAGGLVLVYAQSHREHPGAYVPGLLVFPGPHPREVVALRRTRERVYLGGRIELDVLERRRPFGPPGDEGEAVLYPYGNFAGRRA